MMVYFTSFNASSTVYLKDVLPRAYGLASFARPWLPDPSCYARAEGCLRGFEPYYVELTFIREL